jgi:hypothetical protein
VVGPDQTAVVILGLAFRAIERRRTWPALYATFPDDVAGRWGLAYPTAAQLMRSAEVIVLLEEGDDANGRAAVPATVGVVRGGTLRGARCPPRPPRRGRRSLPGARLAGAASRHPSHRRHRPAERRRCAERDDVDGVQAGRYRHFKGQDYLVMGTATHTETGEVFVLYRAVGDPDRWWLRPRSQFVDQVVHQGTARPRFVYLGEAPARVSPPEAGAAPVPGAAR